MYRIRRFGVLRTANVVALFYLVTFAILIVPVVLLMLLLGTGTGPRAVQTGPIIGGAIAALLIYPIIGWVFTAIACLIYNLVARWVGGIEVQVDRVEPPGYPAAGYPYGSGYGPTYGQVPPGQASGQAPWTSPPGQPPAQQAPQPPAMPRPPDQP